MATTLSAPGGAPTVGTLLRDWRRRRRLSQLDLANEAAVSARHLSFVETGRSKPSPELVMHLAEHLDVPLRERNTLLLAAGYAPRYAHTPLDAEEMAPVRDALDVILARHHPFPAVVADRHWTLVTANDAAVGLLTGGVAPELLEPPANVLRISLHPDGMAPRIVNFALNPAAAPLLRGSGALAQVVHRQETRLAHAQRLKDVLPRELMDRFAADAADELAQQDEVHVGVDEPHATRRP